MKNAQKVGAEVINQPHIPSTNVNPSITKVDDGLFCCLTVDYNVSAF